MAGCPIWSVTTAVNSKHKNCLLPHLLNSQLPDVQQAAGGAGEEQLLSLPMTQGAHTGMGACLDAAGDLEMGLDSAHLKRTSPCPGPEDTLGLHLVGQEVVPCLPEALQLNFSFPPRPEHWLGPFTQRQQVPGSPPEFLAARGPPLPPSPLPRGALSAGAAHLLDKAAPASRNRPLVTAWGVRKAAFGMCFNGDGNGASARSRRAGSSVQRLRHTSVHQRAGRPCPS